MRRNPRWVRLFLVGSVLLAACGGGTSPGSAPTSGGTPSATSSAAGGGTSSGSAAEIHIVLTGGATAGTFNASSDKHCAVSSQTWTADYAGAPDATTGLSILSLVIQAGKTPPLLSIGVTANGYGSDAYNASTIVPQAEPGSTGTASAKDSGTTAQLTFSAKTAKGYSIEGTVKCNQIDRG